ncbi:hypothetical protein Cgig2_001922 [Carnegiea gigantea]|uniref:Ubiquitin-like protease family profile domain-containing protein n=1 Tax=Carnegiea gigantea TaxID=171969 RepID=A0A9Q1K861_9CARY|nr:hypothetical protein Cgig2_001922 [Carnegiea gigantea]
MNEIDFGGFWAIRTNVIPKTLGMWLLENYDYYGSFLNLSNHRILEFTKEDVHATLRLPMGPKKVVEGKTCDSCEKYNALLGSWSLRGRDEIRKMHNGILDQGNHGDEFKRDFVIYVVSTCIKGNQNGDAYIKIMKSLGNVGDIINFNWCEYMISTLSATVFEWRSDPARLFKGPQIFLMEHVNWVIHQHSQLHLSKAINKLITIPVEGSSVEIPGVSVEVLFEYGVEEDDLKFWLNREEMMSMAGATEHLECILLDAWCALMNKEELKRNPDAPKRMFFSHNVFKAVDDETTLSTKFKAFIQVINFEKQRCNWLKFKEMDLVFFVILRKEHYFLLCFDMVRGKMSIIDNRILKTTVEEKYEDCHQLWLIIFISIFIGPCICDHEQYLRLLRPMYYARILMHPINKLRMIVSETVKKFFQQEQQSRNAT